MKAGITTIIFIIACTVLCSARRSSIILGASLPVIECTDLSLAQAIINADNEFTYRDWPALIVCFPDSLASHQSPVIQVFQDIHDKFFSHVRSNDQSVSKHFIGTYKISVADGKIRIFVSGKTAHRFFKIKKDEVYNYLFTANLIMRGETQMLKLHKIKGKWEVVPGSVRHPSPWKDDIPVNRFQPWFGGIPVHL